MSKTAAQTEIEQIGATFARNANAKNVDALVKDFVRIRCVPSSAGCSNDSWHGRDSRHSGKG